MAGSFFSENLEETATNHEKVAGDGFMMVEGEAQNQLKIECQGKAPLIDAVLYPGLRHLGLIITRPVHSNQSCEGC